MVSKKNRKKSESASPPKAKPGRGRSASSSSAHRYDIKQERCRASFEELAVNLLSYSAILSLSPLIFPTVYHLRGFFSFLSFRKNKSFVIVFGKIVSYWI